MTFFCGKFSILSFIRKKSGGILMFLKSLDLRVATLKNKSTTVSYRHFKLRKMKAKQITILFWIIYLIKRKKGTKALLRKHTLPGLQAKLIKGWGGWMCWLCSFQKAQDPTLLSWAGGWVRVDRACRPPEHSGNETSDWRTEIEMAQRRGFTASVSFN